MDASASFIQFTFIFGALAFLFAGYGLFSFVKWSIAQRRFKKMRSSRKTELIKSGIEPFRDMAARDPEIHNEIIKKRNANFVRKLFVVFVFTGVVLGLMHVDIRILVITPFVATAMIAVIEVVMNGVKLDHTHATQGERIRKDYL
jgi:hypothetical protein